MMNYLEIHESVYSENISDKKHHFQNAKLLFLGDKSCYKTFTKIDV